MKPTLNRQVAPAGVTLTPDDVAVDLDESQRAMIGAKPMFEEEARQRQIATQGNKAAGAVRANLPELASVGRAREKAAETVNVSSRSVESASKVLRDGAPWHNLGIAAEPDRIRLNDRRVLSIDGKCPQPAHQEPASVRRLDWEALPAQLGLTDAESAVFMLHWRDGVPAGELAFQIGVSRREAHRLYLAVRAKLGIGKQEIMGCLNVERVRDSSRLTYQDHGLGSAAGPWSLGRLDNSFAEIMRTEFPAVSTRYINDPPKVVRHRVFCARILGEQNVNQPELESQLRIERLKFDKIVTQAAEVRDSVDKSRSKVNELRLAVMADAEQGILDGREPDSRLLKRAEAAEAELVSVVARSDAFTGAIARQREIIDGIAGEIQLNAKAHTLKIIAPKRERANALIEELMILAPEIFNLAAPHNFQPLEAFPSSRDHEEAARRVMVLRSVSGLRDYLSTWTDSKWFIEREHIGAGFFREKTA